MVAGIGSGVFWGHARLGSTHAAVIFAASSNAAAVFAALTGVLTANKLARLTDVAHGVGKVGCHLVTAKALVIFTDGAKGTEVIAANTARCLKVIPAFEFVFSVDFFTVVALAIFDRGIAAIDPAASANAAARSEA